MGWKGAGLSLQSRPLQLSASDKSPLRGAWVCLHVRSAAAAYGDLGKTRVTPSRALTKAIAAAVEQALAQARQRWAELGLLLSAEEQRRRAFERSAPHIAKAIGQVLRSSRSAESELQANCLQLLGAARPEECEAQLQTLLLRCWAPLMGSHPPGARRSRKALRRASPVELDPEFDALADESGGDEAGHSTPAGSQPAGSQPAGSQPSQVAWQQPPVEPPRRRSTQWLGPGWPSAPPQPPQAPPSTSLPLPPPLLSLPSQPLQPPPPPPDQPRCDADASQASSHELFYCSWDAGEPRQLARRSWDASQESRHDLDSW